jgi:hypothetical protein
LSFWPLARVEPYRQTMADPEQPDAAEQGRYDRIPELELDENVAPRPEEEAADVLRSAPADRPRGGEPPH